jgi:hypothetical protein
MSQPLHRITSFPSLDQQIEQTFLPEAVCSMVLDMTPSGGFAQQSFEAVMLPRDVQVTHNMPSSDGKTSSLGGLMSISGTNPAKTELLGAGSHVDSISWPDSEDFSPSKIEATYPSQFKLH